MELEEELRISQVILRMYNRNPAVFINVKLNSFITDVARELQEVFMLFLRIRSSEKKDIGDLTRKHDSMGQASNLQKFFQYLQYKAQLLLTTLLLSIEQLLQNEYNPNLLQTKKEALLDA